VPAVVLSVNVGSPETVRLRQPTTSGILKRPVPAVVLRAPGPRQGGLGSGVVGDDHERLFMYAQARPLSQLPTCAIRSVPSSSDGMAVSLPMICAAIWSHVVASS